MKRYGKNQPIISPEAQRTLAQKKIAIIGLGGLGGYLAHGALRMGIEHLHLVDHDVFSESNLNRQLFCTEESLGQYKADVAKKQLLVIHSGAKITTQKERLTKREDGEAFSDADVLFDALDNIPGRLLLQQISIDHQIPLIHGAIGGYYGQYAFLEANKDRMSLIFRGKEALPGASLACVASLIASYQLLLLMQYFLQDPALCKNQLVLLDLKEHEEQIISLD